jgi:radical SAM superfamily enzyme YgiQ (UPF0313 family)
LEKDGSRVRGIDAAATGYSREQLLVEIGTNPPDVVLWSTGTPSIDDDLALASEIKKVSPYTKTAVFGTHVTALDQACMDATPDLDVIIRNEPEATAAEWIESLEKGSPQEKVVGLTFRAGSRVVRNPDRPFVADLDELPDPAWHLFDLDAYRLPLRGTRFLMVTPHRGCPYPCSYCTAQTFYGSKLRRRSVARVVAEIEHNIEQLGVREFFFWSDTFTIDKRYVMALAKALEPLGISWASNSRVDTIDEEMAGAMRRAGCWMISFGIESGDQSVLDMVGKGAKVEEANDAVRISKQAGLKVAGHFVLGIPGETRESLDKTLALARKLPLDFVQFYCAVPFPGSRLYETARDKGWLLESDFSRFRQDEAIMTLPALTPQEVMAYRQKAYREFYLKPRIAFGALSMLSPRFLKRMFIELGRFVGWSRLR